MAWKDKIKGFFTRSQSDLPWSQTFRMQMRAPAVANRLFDTLEHMEEYLADTSDKASAFVGMLLSVNHSLINDDSGMGDGTLAANDGVYLVTAVGINFDYVKLTTTGDANIICKTNEEWSQVDPRTVYPKGTVLIFLDRFSQTIEGETVTVPGLKIADGTNSIPKLQFIDSFVYNNEVKILSDLGTILAGINARIDDHLADPRIHHSIKLDTTDTELLKVEKVNLIE